MTYYLVEAPTGRTIYSESEICQRQDLMEAYKVELDGFTFEEALEDAVVEGNERLENLISKLTLNLY